MIRRLVLALALAGATLTTGLLGSSASAVQPLVGSCHQLTFQQAWDDRSDPAAPVACTGPHTLQTVAVITSPTPLAGLSDDQVSQLAGAACEPALIKARGSRFLAAQSVLAGFEFAPTAQEIAAGENWFRCDLGVISGTSLQPLPHHVLALPVISQRHFPNTYRKCLAGTVRTSCTHRHTQRAIGAFDLTNKSLRSKAAFERLAHRKCPGATGYVFPSSADLKAGYRLTVCFKKTRH